VTINALRTERRAWHGIFLAAGLVALFLAAAYVAWLAISDTRPRWFGSAVNQTIPAVFAALAAAFLALWAVLHSSYQENQRMEQQWLRGQLDAYESWRASTNGLVLAHSARSASMAHFWIPPMAGVRADLRGWTVARFVVRFAAEMDDWWAQDGGWPIPRTPAEMEQLLKGVNRTSKTKKSPGRHAAAVRDLAEGLKKHALVADDFVITGGALDAWEQSAMQAFAVFEDALYVSSSSSVSNSVTGNLGTKSLAFTDDTKWQRLAYTTDLETFMWLMLVALGASVDGRRAALGSVERPSWISGLSHLLGRQPEERHDLVSLLGDAAYQGFMGANRRRQCVSGALADFSESRSFGGEEGQKAARDGDVSRLRSLVAQEAIDRYLLSIEKTPHLYDLPSYIGSESNAAYLGVDGNPIT